MDRPELREPETRIRPAPSVRRSLPRLEVGAVVLGLLAATGLTACDSAGVEADAVVVRDSAGIEIVESRAPELDAQRWRIGDEPRLRIGVLEGDPRYQFTSVSDASRLSDGTIAVMESLQTGRLVLFDAEGTYITESGGMGEGPGEFRQPTQLDRTPGDSLAVWDNFVGSRLFFDGTGAFLGQDRPDRWDPARLRELIGDRWLAQWTPLPDGSLLILVNDESPLPNAEPRPPAYEFIRVEPESYAADGLGWFPGGEPRSMVRIDGMDVPVLPLLPHGARFAVGRDRVFTGVTLGFNLHAYTLDGELERIIRRTDPPRPVEREDLEELRGTRLEAAEGLENEEMSRRVRIQVDAAPDEDVFPAFSQLLVDDDGNVWVLEYQGPRDDHRVWSVFAADGDPLARLTLLESLQVHEIGSDYILGTERDEFDVAYVVLYDLVKPDGTSQ